MTSSGSPSAEVPGGDRPPRIRRMWIFVVVAVVVVAAGLGAGYYLLTSTPPVNPPPANRAPVAVIHISNSTPVTYSTVSLNASGSSDPDGDALSYHWAGPNGLASDQVSIDYTFPRVGVASFNLTVTDSHGATDVARLNVTVSPAPLSTGTNAPYPPFEWYNGTTLTGFDIDLANAVAARAGYAVAWTNYMDFSTLLQTVAAGGIDMAASAITSSGTLGAVRNSTMYFSSPYFLVSYGALVNTSSNLTCAAQVCTPGDLANRTLAVISGSGAEMWVTDNLVSTNMTPSSMIRSYSDPTFAVAALRAGDVQAFFAESYTVQGIANSSGGSLRVAGTVNTGETYSFAFPRTAVGLVLVTRIDAALLDIIQAGVYQALYLKWFGT